MHDRHGRRGTAARQAFAWLMAGGVSGARRGMDHNYHRWVDVHELWDGWSITVPTECATTRNEDGSWSAWDSTHVIDVHIVTVGGKEDGTPMSADEMLGNDPGEPVTLVGAVGRMSRDTEVTETADGPKALEWTFLKAASENTFLSLGVANSGARDADWHNAVIQGVAHQG